jgi:hypothetical protein
MSHEYIQIFTLFQNQEESEAKGGILADEMGMVSVRIPLIKSFLTCGYEAPRTPKKLMT